jgi:hypothetical protein
MDRQAIDVHGRIAFSNANCALPKTSQKRRWWKVRFRRPSDQAQCWATPYVAEAESPPPLPEKPSIAVLPFQNILLRMEWLRIITALSRFKSVR